MAWGIGCGNASPGVYADLTQLGTWVQAGQPKPQSNDRWHTELVQHSDYRGSSWALTSLIGMVWLYSSPIPVRGGGGNFVQMKTTYLCDALAKGRGSQHFVTQANTLLINRAAYRDFSPFISTDDPLSSKEVEET